MKRDLVWAKYDGDDLSSLTYADATPTVEIVGPAKDVSLEALANFCDEKAEDGNFVGCHRLLATILYRSVGRRYATEIMREIAEHGGLDGMNGVCCAADAYADLGVPAVGRSVGEL